jgi:hypothetical protein
MMKKIKNIRRMDNNLNRTYGWLVQVQRSNRTSIKMFTDGVYGGKRKALAAAKGFLAQVLAELTTFDYHHRRRNVMRCNNTSGIAGVGRYEVLDNPNTGNRAIFWLAAWHDEHGVRRQRKFYISTHGEQKAKKLATAERKKRIREVCIAKCEPS